MELTRFVRRVYIDYTSLVSSNIKQYMFILKNYHTHVDYGISKHQYLE